MKNKLIFLLNSIRQSIIGKPFAFVLLILVFFATTICCSIPSRFLVSGIYTEIYCTPANMNFSISQQNFKDNHTEIGDYIRENVEKTDFDTTQFNSYFNINHFNATIYVNNEPLELEEFITKFIVTGHLGITEENIQNKQNYITISNTFAMEYGFQVGDIINIYGNNLTIQEIFYNDYGTFALPYNIAITEWYSCTPPTNEYNDASDKEELLYGHVYGMVHSGLNNFKKGLKQFGCKIHTEINYGLMISILMVLGMLLICVLSSISIMGYWLKCNNNKYSLYKTLGCSPSVLAFAMIIETLLIAIFSIGIGVIFDYIISISLKFEMPIIGLEWLHYLILIGGPLLSITILAIVAVVKRAIAMPANTKFNSQ